MSPPSEGWAEILVSGLAFDLSGLQPAPAAPARPFDHAYGFAADVPDGLREAVLLVPSGHISAGAALAPVVRAMVGLAANLVLNLPVVAVQWHPARTVIEPRTFVRIIMNWLSGGAFSCPRPDRADPGGGRQRGQQRARLFHRSGSADRRPIG
ncbi:hypothetical protein ACFSTD_14295 [Novosphingobium colocasiae]